MSLSSERFIFGWIRTLILSFALLLSLKAQAQVRCQSVFQETSGKEQDPLHNQNLFNLHFNETLNQNSQSIEQMNLRTIQELPTKLPPTKRVTSVSTQILKRVIQAFVTNPILKKEYFGHYNQSSTEIGYCFGRALYAHLTLLKMGVDKTAIRKAWVVGPMEAGGISWSFHVATIVKGTDNQWYALDGILGGKAVPIQEWYSYFWKKNKAQNLRLYITDPQRFTPELSNYNRTQLGLQLSKEQDWYRGFFQDLLQWFRDNPFESDNLDRL